MEQKQLDELNKTIESYFGRVGNSPRYRLVWSEDQFEKRLVDCTPEGFQLLVPEVRLVPKYRQWIQRKYILERLTELPVAALNELPESPLSYEPIWHDWAIEPTWAPIKFVIENVIQKMENPGAYRQYKEPTTEEERENRKKELAEIHQALFGNETDIGDALAYKEGVGFTHE